MMKKNIYLITLIFMIVIMGYSCSKIDNYAEPSETLTGSVVDSLTGNTLQTEIGSGGIRIKMMEYSWSDNPTPYYFYAMQDGTFNNTKIFAGRYGISVEGAFVPLVLVDNNGDTTSDKTQTMEVKGTTTVVFKVEPFLRVEWVGNPVINADSSITVQVKISRGTANTNFQQELSDVFLFVSNTQYDGNNNYDPRYSTQISYNGSDGNAILGQTISLTTTGGALPGKRDYYVRVGARINYGLKIYNYNEPVKVTFP